MTFVALDEPRRVDEGVDVVARVSTLGAGQTVVSAPGTRDVVA